MAFTAFGRRCQLFGWDAVGGQAVGANNVGGFVHGRGNKELTRVSTLTEPAAAVDAAATIDWVLKTYPFRGKNGRTVFSNVCCVILNMQMLGR